jgi:EmrB/QacA subfamily drug resistance transporter
VSRTEKGVVISIRWRLKEEHAIAVVYVVSLFMASMDSQIVNVALPTLSHDFKVPTSTVQWVVVGYLLSLAVFIPASGWFGDRFGTKRILLTAIALFTLASALCALSSTIAELILFRVLQGAGGGMLTPVGAAMLYRAYPPARRASIQPTLALATVIAPATAPIIGGWMVTKLSWHWIFLVNIPIGAVSLVFGLIFLTEHRESPDARFDLLGFVLSGGGLALVLYALSQGPVDGWGAPEVFVSGALGVGLLSIFVRSQLRSDHPLLRLQLFSGRSFRRSTITAVFSSAAFQGTLFAAPLYLQQGRGFSALVSGLTTFPEIVGVMVSAQLARRTYPIIGPRRLISTGLGVMTAMLVAFAFVDTNTNLWIIRLLLFCIGLGVGQSNLPNQISAFATTSSSDTGHATAIYNAARRASQALGIAVLSTVLSAVSGHRLVPAATAFRSVFLACAAISVLGAVSALRINDSDAAPTMRTRPNTQGKAHPVIA